MQEIYEWLVETSERRGIPARLRREAKALAETCASGIVPSRKRIHALREHVRQVKPSTCARLEANGTCLWLRRHGETERLPVPPVGERAYCLFVDRYDECAGFKIKAPEEDA